MPSPARRFEKRAPSLDNLVERVDAQRPGEVTGDTIPTGFGSLDKLLGGGLRGIDYDEVFFAQPTGTAARAIADLAHQPFAPDLQADALGRLRQLLDQGCNSCAAS